MNSSPDTSTALSRDSTSAVAPWMLVSAALAAAAWGGNEFTPLLVMYRLDAGFSQVVVNMLLFAYVLGIIPALIIGGPLADRFGRRRLMMPSPWIAIAGSIMLALGHDSALLLAAGRVLSGMALGLAMAAGGSWIKELSSPPYAAYGNAAAGARRQGMSLTAGFALGAAAAGILAQWGPAQYVSPYVLHIALTLPVAVLLPRVPETLSRANRPEADRSLRADLRISALTHRRFLTIIVPLAPWVFGASAVAYAILPSLIAQRVASAPIAFSALLCVVTMGCGFAIQQRAARMDNPRSARLAIIALCLIIAGMVLAAITAHFLTIPIALIAAAVLGCAYGTTLQACLLEVQRLAPPGGLAGLTAAFYSLAYLGFAFPTILAALVDTFTYPVMLGTGALVAFLTLLVTTARSRHHLPHLQ